MIVLAIVAAVFHAGSSAVACAWPLLWCAKRVLEIQLSFLDAFFAELVAALASAAILVAIYLLTSVREAGTLIDLCAGFGVSFACRTVV
jgi:hypothetical protein